MDDKELKNSDNWLDFGISDYLEDTEKFKHWTDIAREACRIIDADEDSPIGGIIFTVAAAASKTEFE